jgi:intein-encoded DNA endonuclease-like protein
MSRQTIEAIIADKLADNSNIIPEEHRAVETGILDYIDESVEGFIKVIRKGILTVNDIGSNNLKTIGFADVGAVDYMVIGTIISNSINHESDNDVAYVIREKTSNSFKVSFGEWTRETQNISFQYIIIPF